MKILALITARGGSKRLPGKNIRILGGKPLIVWSIEVAKNVDEICDVLVSTDDSEIADVCRVAGALVPWLRPEVLATDTAASIDVALHALEWYEAENGRIDAILLLQPTSPFRTEKSVRTGINIFAEHGLPVLGVSPVLDHPMWTFKKDGEYLVPFLKDHGMSMRSQDLPPAYVVNGSFYLISPTDLRANRSFFGTRTMPLLIESPKEALDIDTEWDWRMAEALFST
jgi:CMP-N,N'-diacetyllegionaminic acid synthase